MMIPTVSPHDAHALIAAGATLIDIRDADEHAREHIAGAMNVPLTRLGELPTGAVVFHCRSGMRTESNAALLAAASRGDCHILAGGIDGWRAASLPTKVDRSQPLEIMRQVQLVAGGLVVLGVILGLSLAPEFFALAAFVGAGLMVAGATGWCGMARLLRVMPWNRQAAT